MAYEITEYKRKIYTAVEREYRREDLIEVFSEDYPFIAEMSEAEQDILLEKIDDQIWHSSLYYEAYWDCFRTVIQEEQKARKSYGKQSSNNNKRELR